MIQSKNKKDDPKFVRAFERAVMRSAFVSLFWSVIQERKKSGSFTFKALAKAISANKSEVSRWFRGDPNWTVNTIASIANALHVDIEIKAIDRLTGTVFTPAGIERPVSVVTYNNPGTLVTMKAFQRVSAPMKQSIDIPRMQIFDVNRSRTIGVPGTPAAPRTSSDGEEVAAA